MQVNSCDAICKENFCAGEHCLTEICKEGASDILTTLKLIRWNIIEGNHFTYHKS